MNVCMSYMSYCSLIRSFIFTKDNAQVQLFDLKINARTNYVRPNPCWCRMVKIEVIRLMSVLLIRTEKDRTYIKILYKIQPVIIKHSDKIK